VVLVCDTYHGNAEDVEPDADEVERVTLTRGEVRRGRVRATTETGREVGVALDRRLRDGDIVHDDGVAVVVELEPIEAFVVDLDHLESGEAASLGHDLGNAHHEMAVEDGVAYVPADKEARAFLVEYAENPRTVEVEPSVFDGVSRTDHEHGHSHGHEDDHARGGGR
jgi:urease accessory protein